MDPTLQSRSGRCGAVIVEFALAFPMLLITFIFVCQILNVFTYDILGSYAAFAAARSYAVHRNAGWDDEGGFDLDSARQAAATKAYGIVTAIMATYSMPSGDDEQMPPGWSVDQLGIDVHYNAVQQFNVGISEASYYAAHRRLHSNFRIVEYSDELPVVITKLPGDTVAFEIAVSGTHDQTFTIPMKEGYGYPVSVNESPEEESTPWYQWFLDNVITPVAIVFGLREREYIVSPIKVAKISFVYDYPTVLTQATGQYLSSGFAGQRPLRIGIYQACAAPIEPIPSAIADKLEDVSIGRTEEQANAIANETKEKERAIDMALNELHVCIEIIRAALEHDRHQREIWKDPEHPPWKVAAGRVHDLEIVRVNPAHHQALKPGKLNHLLLQYAPDPPPADAPDERKIADHIQSTWGNAHNKDKWLLDPRASLLADTLYRKKIQNWIREEIKSISDEIIKLTRNIQDLENHVSRNTSRIDAEYEKEEPNYALINTLLNQNSNLNSQINTLSETIVILEHDRNVWEIRHRGEQIIIDTNTALIDNCLKIGMSTLEKILKAYYAFVKNTMAEETSVLNDLQKVIP